MIRSFKSFYKEGPISHYLTWEHIEAWILAVCESLTQIRNDKIIVVGIGIGGTMVGRMISLNLTPKLGHQISFAIIDTYYDNNEVLKILTPLPQSIGEPNQTILLVDFDISSGVTVQTALKAILEEFPDDPQIVNRIKIHAVGVSPAGLTRYCGGSVIVSKPYYKIDNVVLAPWMITEASIYANPRWYWTRRDHLFSNEETAHFKPLNRRSLSSPTEANIIFVGHGRSSVWSIVQNYIEKEKGLKVVCWESEPRASRTAVEVLEEFLKQADFAVLVLTAEDETAGGEILARQNVIHEMGLFQSRLGFQRVALLVQRGVKELSNLAGLQTIEFTENKIEESFFALGKMLEREQIVNVNPTK